MDGSPATLSIGNTVGTISAGESTTLDVTGTPSGTYLFRYTVTTGCGDTSDLTVTVLDGAVTGFSVSIVTCITDTSTWQLGDFLKGGDGKGNGVEVGYPLTITSTGVWNGFGTSAGNHTTYGFIPGTPSSDATFIINNGTQNIAPGEYTFSYSVDGTTAFTEDACGNCLSASNITIYVSDFSPTQEVTITEDSCGNLQATPGTFWCSGTTTYA